MIEQEQKTSEEQIMHELQRRLSLLEKADLERGKTEIKQEEKVNNLKKKTTQHLDHLKKEVQDLLEEVTKLKKIIFQTGHVLREKVTLRELEQMQEQINKWELEAFVTRKELERLYSLYAK